MPFQMFVMAVRNSSLVFQRCIKAAISVPITATTAMTGAEIPPRAAPSLPNSPVAPPTRVDSNRMPLASELKPFNAVPTVVMVLPSTMSSGPMAATRAATLRMVSLVLSSILLSLSTNACTADTILRMVGIRRSPKEIASSSN